MSRASQNVTAIIAVPGTSTAVVARGVVRLSAIGLVVALVVALVLALGVVQRAVVSLGAAGGAVAKTARTHCRRHGVGGVSHHPLQGAFELATGTVVERRHA